MAPPGGGRGAVSGRVLALFAPLNFGQPGDAQLRRVFGALLGSRLSEFGDEVRPLCEPLVAASVALFRAAAAALLPTPAKSHYVFDVRDLARLVLGVARVRFFSRQTGGVGMEGRECEGFDGARLKQL